MKIGHTCSCWSNSALWSTIVVAHRISLSILIKLICIDYNSSLIVFIVLYSFYNSKIIPVRKWKKVFYPKLFLYSWLLIAINKQPIEWAQGKGCREWKAVWVLLYHTEGMQSPQHALCNRCGQELDSTLTHDTLRYHKLTCTVLIHSTFFSLLNKHNVYGDYGVK